jgi:hypothetical protein
VEASSYARSDCFSDIRIFTDNEGVRSAQFHHCLLNDSACFGSNRRSRPYASCHGCPLNARVVDDIDDVISLQNQILKDAFREAGFEQDPLELE